MMGVGWRRKGDMPERKTLQLSIHNEHVYSRKQKKYPCKALFFAGKFKILMKLCMQNAIARLPVLKKKCGKIQNVVSSSDFEIFFLLKFML